MLLLLSACWRDSSWVSRFSFCCALQKNLTERWEVIQRELDSLPQVALNLSPYLAWPFADLTRYFSNYIPPIFLILLLGGGGGVEMFHDAEKMNLSITLKCNLLFPSPYERWTLWIDQVSRISFRETLEISFELAYLWALYEFFLSCLYSKSWPCDHHLIFRFISALPVCQVVWLVDLVKKVAPCWSATLSSP